MVIQNIRRHTEMPRDLHDQVVDGDGIRGHEERMKSLRDLGELHSLTFEDLQRNETSDW